MRQLRWLLWNTSSSWLFFHFPVLIGNFATDKSFQINTCQIFLLDKLCQLMQLCGTPLRRQIRSRTIWLITMAQFYFSMHWSAFTCSNTQGNCLNDGNAQKLMIYPSARVKNFSKAYRHSSTTWRQSIVSSCSARKSISDQPTTLRPCQSTFTSNLKIRCTGTHQCLGRKWSENLLFKLRWTVNTNRNLCFSLLSNKKV